MNNTKNPWVHIYDALPPELLRMLVPAANEGRFHLDQLRPDAMPVVRAQIFASQNPLAFALDGNAKLGARLFATRQDLVEVGVANTALLCECLALCRVEFHGPNTSVTLFTCQAFRYYNVKRIAINGL